jgi:nicotinamidase-related amidase
MLEHFEVEELLIAGLVTELCVAETVKSARQLDFPVTIIKDCVWPLDKEEGDKVLAALQKNYGVTVIASIDATSGGYPAVVKEMNVSPPKPEAPKAILVSPLSKQTDEKPEVIDGIYKKDLEAARDAIDNKLKKAKEPMSAESQAIIGMTPKPVERPKETTPPRAGDKK